MVKAEFRRDIDAAVDKVAKSILQDKKEQNLFAYSLPE